MGIKIIWTGLTTLLATPQILHAVGLQPDNSVLAIIGAALMVLGCVLMWLNK